MPTSFMLQLKNVREVAREDGNDEPTGVVVTQVVNNDCVLLIMSKCALLVMSKC